MLKLFLLALSISFNLWAQDDSLFMDLVPASSEVTSKFTSQELQKALEASRRDFKAVYGEEFEKDYVPLGFDVDVVQTSFLLEGQEFKSAFRNLNDDSLFPYCAQESSDKKDLKILSHDIEKIIQKSEKDQKKVKGGMIYVIWGYHSANHSRSDATFKTPDGTFTVHGAAGEDRPTSGFLTYINPAKLSIPQYNLRIGYRFNNNFMIQAGTDHMKWVFVQNSQSAITGSYRDVWVNGVQVPFEEVKKTGDTSWLKFEHTDGYNYVNIGALYALDIAKVKRFKLEAQTGLGAGVFIPKTRVQIHDGATAETEVRDVDNKFNLAGYGFHADLGLELSYTQKNGNKIFVLGNVRGVYGKIDNALFLGSPDGSISQTPILSTQQMLSAGYAIPIDSIFKKGKKK